MAGIDLLPASYRQRQRRKRLRRWISLGVVLLLALGLVQGLQFAWQLQYYRQEVERLQDDRELVQPFLDLEAELRDKRGAIARRQELLDTLAEQKVPWAALVRDAREITGEEVSLDYIGFDEDGNVNLSGQGSSLEDVAAYLQRVDDMHTLDDPRLESAVRVEDGQYSFSITGHVDVMEVEEEE